MKKQFCIRKIQKYLVGKYQKLQIMQKYSFENHVYVMKNCKTHK